MKKLMTALAAVAVAAVSQAASIDWAIGNNQWTLDDGSKASLSAVAASNLIQSDSNKKPPSHEDGFLSFHT